MRDGTKVFAESANGGSLFSHRRDNENINVRSHGDQYLVRSKH